MDSPIPPVAATQPLPPVLPPAEKSKSWLKILLAIIGVLVILGLFGNLYLLARNQKPAAEITPTPTLIAATPTPDLTANWKTYVSQALRISFKYPDSYVEPKESNNYLSVISQLNPNRPAKDSSLQNGELKIEIVTEPAKSENTPESCWSDHNDGGGKIIGDGSIGIAGSQLKTIIWEGEGTGEFTCLLRNNTRYLINKYPAKTSRQDEYKLIFSTFKFLDQNQADLTTSWKTFQSSDITFKYPAGWTKSGDFALISVDPKIRLVVIPKGNTLMNECMMKTSVETKGNLTIKKFSRVTTGAMCGTSDSTPREIWVIPSPDAYAPGISYEYLSTQGTQAESIFDQILSTFKFLQ